MKKLTIALTALFLLSLPSCTTMKSILRESGRYIRLEPARIQFGKSGGPQPSASSGQTSTLVLPTHVTMTDTFDIGDQLILKQIDIMDRISKGPLYLTFADTVSHFDPERFIEYKKVVIRKIPVKHQKIQN